MWNPAMWSLEAVPISHHQVTGVRQSSVEPTLQGAMALGVLCSQGAEKSPGDASKMTITSKSAALETVSYS